MPKIGVIGGSGLYEIEALTDKQEKFISTPFGEPSAAVVVGRLDNREVAFVPRHGRGHVLTPTEVNYRANVCALKQLGVRYIISVSAVGSLKEEIAPTHLVVPDQFIDRTRHRRDTFFSDGIVAHVSLADPFSNELRAIFVEQAKKLGVTVHDGGTYICMEGPQYSTRAESRLYRSWGADIIGMTNLTEARLAREAEIAYATLAFSTDYDCWHEEDVTSDMVMENFAKNVETAKDLIQAIVPAIDLEAEYPAHNALAQAMLTRPEHVPQAVKERLKPIAGKYLK
ncbi:MAG: S-methyl-5'-thioadenosine phosphorylase [Candidatus Coatesbacteria bacterium]|nr:S-methyl-5'-thioadenosine phosphorylase [Candidatus Coatesbacteria bacterium]